MPLPFSSVLLAAGHSIRMRRDKALLELDGRLMWQRQRELLADAGAEEIFLSARSTQVWAESAEGFSGVVRDASLESGPLGGIAAGLERAMHGHLAVLAVDLPRMQSTWFRMLTSQLSPGRGMVGKLGNFYEPLAAIYPKEILPLAQEALENRQLSLQRLIAAGVAEGLMAVHDISPAEALLFTNWNEPGPA